MSGSVFQDKRTGRWGVSKYWEGVRYRIFQYNGEYIFTERVANKLLSKIQADIDNGTFVPKAYLPESPLSVRQYAEQWLSLLTVCTATKRFYRHSIAHAIRHLGDEDIRNLTHAKLLKFVQALGADGLGDKARANAVRTLRSMLGFAYKNEDIARIPPFPTVKVAQKEAIEYLDMEQQASVVSCIPEEHRGVFLMAMEYGLRIGEVRAIQWDAVEGDTLTVKRSWSAGTDLRQTTKTGEFRVYGLTDRAREIVETERRRHPFSKFVFMNKGWHYSASVLSRIWNGACKEAGIKIKLYNAARHSLGCQLLNEGYSLDLVQDALGHRTQGMTRRYAQRSRAQVTEALQNRGKVVQFKKEVK